MRSATASRVVEAEDRHVADASSASLSVTSAKSSSGVADELVRALVARHLDAVAARALEALGEQDVDVAGGDRGELVERAARASTSRTTRELRRRARSSSPTAPACAWRHESLPGDVDVVRRGCGASPSRRAGRAPSSSRDELLEEGRLAGVGLADDRDDRAVWSVVVRLPVCRLGVRSSQVAVVDLDARRRPRRRRRPCTARRVSSASLRSTGHGDPAVDRLGAMSACISSVTGRPARVELLGSLARSWRALLHVESDAVDLRAGGEEPVALRQDDEAVAAVRRGQQRRGLAARSSDDRVARRPSAARRTRPRR